MTRSLFAITLLFCACGGSGGGGGQDVIVFPDGSPDRDVAKTPIVYGDPLPLDWQHSYGFMDMNGSSRDKEAIVGLASAPDGTVYALTDRRYGSDPDGEALVLLAFDPAGALSEKALLQFTRGATVQGFARAPSGALLLANEFSDLNIAATSATGEPTWSVSYDREPYAFGGLDLHQLTTDEAGNIYFAGAFSPSEPNLGERGYVAKLDPSGAPLCMRSWPHDSFFGGVRVAVGSGAVFVSDRTEGSEFSDSVLLAFTPTGESLGQKYLSYDAFDGPRSAISRAALVPNGAGATLVGLRTTAVDGDFNLYVYRLDFDATFALTAKTGTKLPTEQAVGATTFRLAGDGAGSFQAVIAVEDRYALLEFSKDEPVAAAYDLIRDDLTTPILEDDDFPVLVAPGPAGSVYLAATTDVPGAIVLRPRTTVAIDLPLELPDAALSVTSDMLVVTDTGEPFSTAPEDRGLLDDPQPDDEDALVLRATLP
jgi:outer membrane protein assembly factor BamB